LPPAYGHISAIAIRAHHVAPFNHASAGNVAFKRGKRSAISNQRSATNRKSTADIGNTFGEIWISCMYPLVFAES